MEEVLNIVDREKPDGVIVQFGGQTPLKLALPLERAAVKIIGTSPDNIDLAEDRERFAKLLNKLSIEQPDNGIARSYEAAFEIAERLGYPVLVRPSYVLGGRAMQIVYDRDALKDYMTYAVAASPEHPVLIDKFLDDAIEVDVDALSDGDAVVIGGIMEHIERASLASSSFSSSPTGCSPCPRWPSSRPGNPGSDQKTYHRSGDRTQCPWPHERSIRRAGEKCLRARGQPTGLAHGSFCQQGHRRTTG